MLDDMHEDYVLLVAGSNSSGQLGLDHQDDSHTLQKAKTEDGGIFPPPHFAIIDLSSGANHTVCILLSTDGDEFQVWGCGSGKEGQLGKRITSDVSGFRRLNFQLDLGLDDTLGVNPEHNLQPLIVRCGWESTFISIRNTSDHKCDDILLVLGTNNDFGQLGQGHIKKLDSAVSKVPLPRQEDDQRTLRISLIACGLRHNLVLCTYEKDRRLDFNMTLFGWGAGRHGQLGVKKAVYWDPHVVDEWQGKARGPVFIDAGKEHTIYYDAGKITFGKPNHIRYLGSNRQGEQLICNLEIGPIQDAGCTWNAVLIAQEHAIVGSGNNSKGQLGRPDVQINGIANFKAFGLNKVDIRAINCGSEHVLALVQAQNGSSTQVFGWGWNEHGNLAQGDEIDKKEPVRIWPTTNNVENLDYRPTRIWAGCGTTFVFLKRRRTS